MQRAFYTGQGDAVSPGSSIDSKAASSGKSSVQGHLLALAITALQPVRRYNGYI